MNDLKVENNELQTQEHTLPTGETAQLRGVIGQDVEGDSTPLPGTYWFTLQQAINNSPADGVTQNMFFMQILDAQYRGIPGVHGVFTIEPIAMGADISVVDLITVEGYSDKNGMLYTQLTSTDAITVEVHGKWDGAFADDDKPCTFVPV